MAKLPLMSDILPSANIGFSLLTYLGVVESEQANNHPLFVILISVVTVVRKLITSLHMVSVANIVKVVISVMQQSMTSSIGP